MFCDERLLEFIEKINGIALRKAELSGDKVDVYSRIFQSLTQIEDPEDITALEVLGELGG
ncbi:MAG: hypothetical protein N3D78_00250 [Candidatus Aenigmarchaeota archaeon]|nr:hypothetical protein [Candidatus Aenigmarchaeota archaeon]